MYGGGGYGSGYGSGYGNGYGGYGSSYGSSYGGYGGYGMGGMGGMGMYGMGGMGMMGGNQNQKGFLFNSMMALESFTYMINCLCQIARSMDQNYEGLSLFYQSFKSMHLNNKDLIGRMENSVISGFRWVIQKIKNFFLAIFNFFVQNIFFMGNNKLNSKYKSVKFILTASIVALGFSMYPLVRSLAKAAH